MVQSNTADICSPGALSTLTSCLSKLCSTPVETQSLVAGLDVSINPKLEYSCEMSETPASTDDGATIPLNGSCSNSPYPFKSFLPRGVSAITENNGCKIELYSEDDCLGSAGSVDIATSETDQCIFRGGKSARLTCNNELDGQYSAPSTDTRPILMCSLSAARAYIDKTCGASPAAADTDTSSLAGYGPASTSSSPILGSGQTSIISVTWIPITPTVSWTCPAGTPSCPPSLGWGPTYPTTSSAQSTMAGPETGSATTSASDTSIHTMTVPWIPMSGTGSTSSMTITVSDASESAWPTGNATLTSTNTAGAGNVTMTNTPSGTASSSVPFTTYTGAAARVGHAELVGYGAVVGMAAAFL